MAAYHTFLCFIFCLEPISKCALPRQFTFKNSTPPALKLCCNFINDKYEVADSLVPEPEWGRYPNRAHTLHLDSVEALANNIVVIQTVLEAVVSEIVYNNVDIFKQFYNDFKKFKLGFKTFFEGYRPQYLNLAFHDAHIFEVIRRVVDSLVWKIPRIQDYVFLAASVSEASEIFVHSFHNPDDIPPSLQYFDHIMGAIKFSLPSSIPFLPKKRYGCILMDPGNGITFPIIVMEDKMPPHGAFGPFGSKGLEYTYLPNSREFIVAVPRCVKDKHVPIYSYWIYVGLSYCSFLDSTVRYELLTQFKSMTRRSFEGLIQGGFYFSILPNDQEISPFETENYKNESRPYFVVHIDGDEEDFRLPVSFRRIKEPYDLTDVQRHAVYKVSLILGMKIDQLIRNLQTIGEMLEDQAFFIRLTEETIPAYTLTTYSVLRKSLTSTVSDNMKKMSGSMRGSLKRLVTP